MAITLSLLAVGWRGSPRLAATLTAFHPLLCCAEGGWSLMVSLLQLRTHRTLVVGSHFVMGQGPIVAPLGLGKEGGRSGHPLLPYP